MKTAEFWRRNFTFAQFDELMNDYEILLDIALNNREEVFSMKARWQCAAQFLRIERKRNKELCDTTFTRGT